MKRKMILATCLTLLLTGCTSPGDRLNDSLDSQIKEKAGITGDDDYEEYEKLDVSGQLKSGEYYEQDTESQSESNGTIHVTIAENSNMSINYYFDEGMSEPTGNSFYLNPGDVLYADNPQLSNNNYEFLEYRIYECSSGDVPVQKKEWKRPSKNVVMQIPMDFDGKELMIEPVGQYSNKNLNFLKL